MVLENSTNSFGDTNDSSQPAGPRSPSIDTRTIQGKLQLVKYWENQVDPNKVGSPPPLVGPLFGYTKDYMVKYVASGLAGISLTLSRPMTQSEIDSHTEHFSSAVTTASWGSVVGLAVGQWRAYQTRDSWRWPFYTPNAETFKPDELPNSPNPMFKGARALLYRQFLRYSAYGFVGAFVGRMIFQGIGATRGALATAKDPRLEQWRKDFGSGMVAQRDRRRGAPGVPPQGIQTQPTGNPQIPDESAQSWPSQPELPTTQQSAAGQPRRMWGGRPAPVDDASPTAPGYEDDAFNQTIFGGSSSSEQGADTGVEGDNQIGSRRSRRGRADRPKQLDADASPVSSEEGSESAWDRIRRNAQSGNGSS